MNLVEVWFGIIERRPSIAAPSVASATPQKSGLSSTAGTTAAIPLLEPKPPTTSSQKPTAEQL
jgi:hypothetical protein